MSTLTRLTPEKCQCNNRNCTTYGFRQGTFYQGCGFEQDQAEEIARRYNDYHVDIADREARIQYLVDNWPTKLEDGCITFPDGETWYQKKEIQMPINYDVEYPKLQKHANTYRRALEECREYFDQRADAYQPVVGQPVRMRK